MEKHKELLEALTLASYRAEGSNLVAGKYRVAGVEIEACVYGEGLFLRGIPALYEKSKILSHLLPDLKSMEIFVLPVCDSTNLFLLSRSPFPEKAGSSLGALAVSEFQRSGRGRRGRTWASPPFVGAWFTVWAFESCLSSLSISPASLSCLCCAGVLSGLEKWCGSELEILWPNDICFKGKKLGGILIEKGKGGFAVGVGINVAGNPQEYGIKNPLRPACTVEQVGERVEDRNELVASCCNCIFRALSREGIQAALRLWSSRQLILGREVLIRAGKEVIKGSVSKIDPERGIMLGGESVWILPEQIVRVERI